MYALKRELYIDEQMTGTKFRISFIQYMPKKPKKFGLKIHALCELVSGYCLSFQIYTRKNEKAVEHRFSHRVVFDLLQRFLGKRHQFYFHNFSTIYELVDDLQQQSTLAWGIVRKGRAGQPESFEKKKLEKGDSEYFQQNNIFACHWKANKMPLAFHQFRIALLNKLKHLRVK